MLCLGWMFLWLVADGRIQGFNISDCATKTLLWAYSSSRGEEFVIFCDLSEAQKPHFHHRSQLSPTRGPQRLPCNGSKDLSDVQWYLQPQDGEPLGEIVESHPHIIQDKNTLHFLTPWMNHSGLYVCMPRIRSPWDDEACCIKMVLKVEPQLNASCQNHVSHKQNLLLGSIAHIHCPSLSCQSDVKNPEMTWYQDGRLLPEKRSNPIVVDEIYDYHQGTYVCDYIQSDNTGSWTVRAVVQVRTIVKNTKLKPDILDPIKDTVEVEIGKPVVLPCKVRFGFEKNFNPVIRWYIMESNRKWETPIPKGRSVKSTLEDEIIERVLFLKKVTQSDLHKRFLCFAQNSIGNTTRSIQLKEKKGVVLAYILLGTVVTLLGLLAASALLYVYWIEIVLLCQTYRSKDETLGDEKEFDAFVSYAKWSLSECEASPWLSEELLALNLFPEVLEKKYGYSLCLLDRDAAPGGVYTEDIIDLIKKSRRGVFILSPNYVNGPSIFELQAAVNLALDDKTLKLILIKFRAFEEPESLPHLVKKALRVLPTVTWQGLKSVPPSSRFWTQMRYHMPVKNAKEVTCSKLRIIPQFFSPTTKDSASLKPLGGASSLKNSELGKNMLSTQHRVGGT